MAQTKLKPKRAWAWLLTLCMVVGMLPMNALADESGGLALVGVDVCICDSLCDEDNINADCTVCAEDYTKCAYDAEQSNDPLYSNDGNGLNLIGGDVCICDSLCDEDSVNTDCTVCAEDYTLCEYDSESVLPFVYGGETQITSGAALSIMFAPMSVTGNWQDAGNVASSFAGGTGTEADPYQINTAGQLAYLASVVNAYTADDDNEGSYNTKCYALTSNIDLGEHDWTPIGNYASNNNNYRFMGTFDGKGFTISNLIIQNAPVTKYVGLFGLVVGATLKNIKVDTVTITYDRPITLVSSFVGGLVAFAGSINSISSNIVNCSITNINIAITATTHNSGDATIIGGLVGQVTGGGKINACSVTGSISGVANANSGALRIGGLVGQLGGGEQTEILQNSFSTCNITGLALSKVTNQNFRATICAGGLVGENYATVKNCFATGNVTGTSTHTNDTATQNPARPDLCDVGGVIGFNNTSNGGNSSFCYWDDTSASQSRTIGETSGTQTTDTNKYGVGSDTSSGTVGNMDTTAMQATTFGETLNTNKNDTAVEWLQTAGSLPTLKYTEPVTVTSVTIKTAPTKTTYTAGEMLDLTGLVVTLNKSDGSIEEVALNDFTSKNITTNPTNGATLTAANTAVTITYTTANKTVNQTITVSDASVYDISLDPSIDKTFTAATVGYGEQTAHSVTVNNTGNQATRALTVALSGTHDTSYTLSKTSINSIATSGSDSFTVTPNTGLLAGTYTATVTVSGGNGISKTFNVSFTVTAATTYSISASTLTSFGSLQTPYTQPSAQTVTITNTGTGSVTLTQPTATNYTIGTLSATTIASGATVTFTVQPKAGLAVGSYNETITISGDNGASTTVSASFTVTAAAPVTVTSVTIQTPPTKVTYTAGEALDLTGLVVTLNKSDSGTENVAFANFGTKGITVSPANGTTLTTAHTSVTITYTADNKTVSQTITVNAAPVTVTSVTVQTPPTKVTYTAGEALDLTGLVVTLNKSDSGTEDVTFTNFGTKGITVSPTNGTTLTTAHTSVTITYTADNKTVSQTITVNAAPVTVTSVTVKNAPTKTTYTAGETLDLTGLVVTLNKSDTSMEDVAFANFASKNITANPANGTTLTTAHTAVTITYTTDNKTVNQTITVNAANGYTISFNANGGSVSPATMQTGADGKLTGLPTPTRSGSYSFNGWYTATSGGSQITTSTVFNANTTVYAHWTYTGGGGYYPPDPTPEPTPNPNNIIVETNGTSSYTATVKDNTLTAEVPVKSVNDSVDKLLKDLETNPGKEQVIEIKVSGASDEVNTAEFSLPNTAILNVVEKTDAALFIDAGKLGTLVFDNNALAAIIDAGKGDLRIITTDITNETDNKLTDEQKATIGNNPVYDFSVFVGSERVSEFGLGTVTISLPYTPKTGENTDSIVVYYVDDNGNIKMVENSRYDSETGTIIFTTNHFSLYMIGNQFTVTYRGNRGGTVSEMPSDEAMYDNGSKVTVIGIPISTSKFFAGWNTKADGTGKLYTAGKTFKITENITLYAQWKDTATGTSKLKYKVTGKNQVACIGITDTEATSIVIGNTITYKGITYKITSIAKNAFRGNEKITTVKIGNNVKTINNTAFYKCPNLKKVTIGTGLVTLGNDVFCHAKVGCVITINSTKLKTVKTAMNHGTKNMVIKVPKNKLSAYKKLFAEKSKTISVEAK